jgi:glycosyltransferase involved in cell wall biosynthesis
MQNHTACLTRALDGLDVRQDVLTTRPPGAPVTQRLGRHATVHRHGLPVRLLRQCYAPAASLQLLRLAPQADVVHAHLGEDLAVVPAARAAARAAGIPLVLTIHLSLQHTLAGRGPRTAVLRHLGGAIERWGVDAADAIVVLTHRLEQRLVAAGVPAEKVHVIPSGVVPADYAAAAPSPIASIPGPRVAFVGRLAPQKGVMTLVEAAARLRTTDATVVLVGDGPDRPALERRVAELGLGDRVRFAGFVAHDRVPAVLRDADLMVLPSIYEELGSVLLEAMQAGVPIVASRTGGIPDAVGRAADLVEPGDPVALAEAIDRVLGDPLRALAMATRGRERARRFDWSLLARRVLGVYEDVLAPSTTALPLSVPAVAASA